MLVTQGLLQSFNHIDVDTDDENELALIDIYIGSAQQIINDYVGFDVDTVETSGVYTASQISMFKNVELRIATLLQLEAGARIGVNSSSDVGVSHSFMNVVDYTPYLKPLAAFRINTGM